MNQIRFRRLPVLLLALALGGLTACGENPVADEHEEHPVGLALIGAGGVTVVTITEGTDGAAVSGQVAVPAGGTVTFTVVALAEDGDTIDLDGDDLAVRVATQPANAAVAVQGASQLTVTGGATAGSGAFRLELVHEGHAELGAEVPVVVQ